jgi:hypothetical protein
MMAEDEGRGWTEMMVQMNGDDGRYRRPGHSWGRCIYLLAGQDVSTDGRGMEGPEGQYGWLRRWLS